jgi:hypothetical protein
LIELFSRILFYLFLIRFLFCLSIVWLNYFLFTWGYFPDIDRTVSWKLQVCLLNCLKQRNKVNFKVYCGLISQTYLIEMSESHWLISLSCYGKVKLVNSTFKFKNLKFSKNNSQLCYKTSFFIISIWNVKQ